MLKHVVYIAGFSSVGKKHTIRSILAGESLFIERYQLSGNIKAFGYAFDAYSIEEAAKADVVLVQWQVAEHDRVLELKQRFPEAKHTILFLLRDWGSHLRSHHSIYSDVWKPTLNELKLKTIEILYDYFSGIGPIELVRI